MIASLDHLHQHAPEIEGFANVARKSLDSITTLRQFSILMMAAGEPGITTTVLAEKLDTSGQNVRNTTVHLENLGLLETELDHLPLVKNGKIIYKTQRGHWLTTKGVKFLESLFEEGGSHE